MWVERCSLFEKYRPSLELFEEDVPGSLSLPELPQTLSAFRIGAGEPNFQAPAPAVWLFPAREYRQPERGTPAAGSLGYQIAM